MSQTDLELLRRYAQDNSEDAFAEIVRRHLDLVFSAAMRQIRNSELAQEVAQSAFIELARQAGSLKPDTILSAWLYQVARRKAIDVVRRESRRQLREQVAQELTAMNVAATDWTQIEPLLDEGMHALEEKDRAAVLLRYFERKSLREVAETMGINEDAARKRVSRAVARLREFFGARGVSIAENGLIVAVTGHAVQAAPAGLGATITTAGMLAGKTIAAATATTKAIVMTTLQKGLIGATVAATAIGIYQAREASSWHTQFQQLQQRQGPLTEQLEQLARATNDFAGQLLALRQEKESLQGRTGELLRLRGEVGVLKNQLAEKPKPQQQNTSPVPHAENEITPEDELKLQGIARMNYVREWVLAFSLYAEQNQGRFPTNFDQADPFLREEAKAEAKLKPHEFLPGTPKFGLTPDRFEITYQGSPAALSNASSIIVLREKEPWQNANGSWMRAYAFADGHSEIHRAGDDGFERWEAQHGLASQEQH